MRRFPMALILTALLATPVAAQNAPIAATPTVRLTSEQEHIIKEIVIKDFNFPQNNAGDLKVGERMPGNIALQAFPAQVTDKVAAIKAHQFFLNAGKIVIVDPKDSIVADIVD